MILQLDIDYDPCRDPDLIAARYADERQHDAEIGLRTYLTGSGDVLDWYNLAAALRDAGYPVRSWFEEVVSLCDPRDQVLPFALDVLGEECEDPEEARRIFAHADHLRERLVNGSAEEGHAASGPPDSEATPARLRVEAVGEQAGAGEGPEDAPQGPPESVVPWCRREDAP